MLYHKLFGNNITMKIEHDNIPETQRKKKVKLLKFYFASQIAICCCWWFAPPEKHLSVVFHIFIPLYKHRKIHILCIHIYSTHPWRQHQTCLQNISQKYKNSIWKHSRVNIVNALVVSGTHKKEKKQVGLLDY